MAKSQLRSVDRGTRRHARLGARSDRLFGPHGEATPKTFRDYLRLVLPPLLVSCARHVLQAIRRGEPEWEHVREGWVADDPTIKGWDVDSIVERYDAKYPVFMQALEGTEPLIITSSSALATERNDLRDHNAITSYAYALALAGANREHLSVLDWGGGVGLYLPLTRVLLPDVAIEYHCWDVPRIARRGRELFPEARFHEDASCLERRYDLVLASRSLHYAEDWRNLVQDLARVATRYFYAVIPVCFEAPTFVLRHRAYSLDFDTEFLTWVFNRDEFVERVTGTGMTLLREFVIGYESLVPGAPESDTHWGFLFRRADARHPRTASP